MTDRKLTLRSTAGLAVVLALAALGGGSGLFAASVSENNDRGGYVLFRSSSQSVTMASSLEDFRRARAARTGREPMLYVRRGGTAYAIRDAVTLQRAAAIFAPQEALGARQAALGARQQQLGGQQARLGAKQGALGRRMPGASRSEAAALNRRQSELGIRQSALGEQQSALGAQQSALGREQQHAAREANAKLDLLVDEAVRHGFATPVK